MNAHRTTSKAGQEEGMRRLLSGASDKRLKWGDKPLSGVVTFTFSENCCQPE